MSRRPRLVEVGVPIGGSTTLPEHHSRNMEEEDAPCSSAPTPIAASSSLSRAAGGMRSTTAASAGTAPSSSLPTTYKVVIGGAATSHDASQHPENAASIPSHATMAHIPCHHFTVDNGTHDEDDSLDAMMMDDHSEERYPSRTATMDHHHHHHHHPQGVTRTHLEIGAPPPSHSSFHDPPPLSSGVEKMTGVEDLSIHGPLIVMDGANVAYAYAQAWQHHDPTLNATNAKLQPDLQGLRVACDYFMQHDDIRVVVVLPQPFFSREQAAILSTVPGLVAAPSRDDDDAYVLRLALREQQRRRGSKHGPVHVLSNDRFRDARDAAVRAFLQEHEGRISYTFGNLGRLDDHGDPVLDIIPNPRHPFVQWMEAQYGLNPPNDDCYYYDS